MRHTTDLTHLFPIGKTEPSSDGIPAISKQIRQARIGHGLTQTELAGLSGTGLRFISELERGKPTVSLKKVVDVLSVLGLKIQLVEANR
jgi:HTH-type transcriptional regulator/antitoxin HipB